MHSQDFSVISTSDVMVYVAYLIAYVYFPMTQQPLVGQGPLII
jgi:hypothetical protein